MTEINDVLEILCELEKKVCSPVVKVCLEDARLEIVQLAGKELALLRYEVERLRGPGAPGGAPGAAGPAGRGPEAP